MNKKLEYLLNTGSLVEARSLAVCDSVTDGVEYYVTQYEMKVGDGTTKWWCTWKNPEQENRALVLRGGFYENDARASFEFPACLNTRIPPESREGIDGWLKGFGLEKYDKFDIIVATKGLNPNRLDYVEELATRHCDFDCIAGIDAVITEVMKEG